MPAARATPQSRPAEHWDANVGDADVAHLDIPADAEREREFYVSCSFVVAHHAGLARRDSAWHEMRVQVNGVHEWSRRVPTDAGERDSLDTSFRRHVPVGEPLRLNATTQVSGARRISLRIVADEET